MSNRRPRVHIHRISAEDFLRALQSSKGELIRAKIRSEKPAPIVSARARGIGELSAETRAEVERILARRRSGGLVK
jgi:CRP-like cAMP-binding protein